MPTEYAKKYLQREMEISRRMHHRFCANLLAIKIKYRLSFIICLLSYGLLIVNISLYGKLIVNPGVVIALALIGPVSMLTGIHYWIEYRKMNG